MVASVTQIQPIKTQTQTTGNVTRASIFYINDEHSYLPNMEKLKSVYDKFEKTEPKEKTDKLVLSPGDIAVGADSKLARVAVAFENEINVMASAIGNHELDLTEKEFFDVTKDAKYKILGFNTNIDPSDEMSQRVTKSYVQEINGNKYGIIGLLPFDLKFHLKDADRVDNLHLMSLEETIPKLQKQIDDFKSQGIDKIIIVSHAGYENDVKMAQAVEGIDVILGGHSHDVLESVQEGKNLFYSKKTGEPTIITQAGKEGRYFGVLNLEFDDKGVIKKAQNNVNKTKNFPKSLETDCMINKILGPAEVVGKINTATPLPANSLIEENANLEFISDAMRDGLGTDIALVNSGNIRSSLEAGPVNTRELAGLTPFKNRMCVIKLSEKDLVEATKIGAKSFNTQDSTPGLLQFSGLKYTVAKTGELKEMTFVDKNGQATPIDINNPNPFKTYTVAMDDFVAKGGNKYMNNKWDEVIAKYDFDKDKLVADYIKKQTSPIDIKPDGRLKVVEN